MLFHDKAVFRLVWDLQHSKAFTSDLARAGFILLDNPIY